MLRTLIDKFKYKKNTRSWGSAGKGVHVYYKNEIRHPECLYCGDSILIGNGSKILIYLDAKNSIGTSVKIGNHFFARDNLTILCAAPGCITIGNNVSFGGHCFITNESHGIDPTSINYRDNPLVVKNVTIEDGVWLGESVSILPGVTIGKKCIIGAASVVTKDIPPLFVSCRKSCENN